MRTAAVSLTRASSRRTPGPESRGSAPEGHLQQPSMQASTPAGIPQCVGGNAVDDDCHESLLDNTLTVECESDSSPCKKSSAELRGVSSSVTGGSSTITIQYLQSVETSKRSQNPKASRKVTTLDMSQTAQYRETAAAESEKRFTRAVRKTKPTITKTMTAVTTTTSRSSCSSSNRSSPSSSLIDGMDFDCWRTRTYSSSCAGGDNEDKDTTRPGTSSIDLVEYYDYLLKRIDKEKEKVESIIGAIGNCMAMITSMSDYIRSTVLQVFGKQRLTLDTLRKFLHNRKKGKRSVAQKEEARGPNGDFELRLQAVKAYLDDGSGESEVIPEAKVEVESSTVVVPEEGACCPTSSNTQQATASNDARAGSSEDITAAAVNRKEQWKGRVTEAIRQQPYDDIIRKRQAGGKSWDNHMVVIRDNAEQRILKGKYTCRAMLSCIKSVANVVNMTTDAYRATELAMQKARTCRSAPAGDILQAVTTAAAETSDWMWKALSHAEAAVRLHSEFVEAIARAERTLYTVQLEDPFDDGKMRDVTAAVEDAKMLIPRTRVFGSYAAQSDEQPSGSTYKSPPTSSDVGCRASTGTDIAAGFQNVASDVLKNLIAATRSTLRAVGAAAIALEDFSTCECCTGKKLLKRRGSAKKIVKDKP